LPASDHPFKTKAAGGDGVPLSGKNGYKIGCHSFDHHRDGPIYNRADFGFQWMRRYGGRIIQGGRERHPANGGNTPVRIWLANDALELDFAGTGETYRKVVNMKAVNSRLSPEARLRRMRRMFAKTGGILAEDYEHFTGPGASNGQNKAGHKSRKLTGPQSPRPN
jgi:hypothetical protein